MQSRIFKRQLDNGLRVLVQERPAAQVVSVVLGVDAGSADEGEDQHGAAHFVEHMLFKGTQRRCLGQIDEEIEGIGGSINAYTSHDETVYYSTVRAGRWKEALDILVDMFTESLFREEDLEIERQVILEELRGTQESPGEVLGRALSRAIWPAHPYGRPVGGLAEEVESLDPKAIETFWKSWYQPGRLVLSVAGPVESKEVVSEIEGRFAAASSPKTVSRSRPNGAAAEKSQWVFLEREFRKSLFELAFPAPPLGHPDVAALDVLATVLGGSESSPLISRLQLETGLANAAWATVSPRRDGGAFYVGCQPARGREKEALAATWAVLRQVVAEGLSEEEVARAKALIRADRQLGLQTVEALAMDALWYELLMGDPEAGRHYDAQIASVSGDQVLRQAESLFDPEEACSALITPKGVWTQSDFKSVERSPMPAVVTRSARLECELPGGAQLLVEPSGDGALSALRVLGLGGRLLETRASAGSSRVWAASVVCGAGPLNNMELADRLSLRGAGLASASYGPTMKLGIDCRREVLDEAMEWLTWLLFEPHFDSDEIFRLQREALDWLESKEDRAGAMAWEAVKAMVFSNHPYGLPRNGTKRGLKTLSVGRMKRFHSRWAQSENLVFSVVGSGEPDRVAARLARLLAPLAEREGEAPTVPSPVFPSEEREQCVRAGRGQSQVVLAWGTKGLDQPDRLALDLAASVLGSPGGRLFQTLRDKFALAYDVDAGHATAPKGGIFSLELSTEAGRSEEARDRLMDQLALVSEKGVTQEELDRAKAKLFFARVDALQLPGSRAAEIAYWQRCTGTGFDRVDEELAALEKVSVDAVQVAVSDLIDRGGRVCVRSQPLD